MTLTPIRCTEPVYTVFVREEQAHEKLALWVKTSTSIQARIDQAKMYIYDQNTLNLFVLTWTHGWGRVVVWDNWQKRHIYF